MVQKVLLKKILAELILTRLIFARYSKNFKNNKVNFRAVKYDIGKCFKTKAYIVYYVLEKTFLSFIFGFLFINKRAFFSYQIAYSIQTTFEKVPEEIFLLCQHI